MYAINTLLSDLSKQGSKGIPSFSVTLFSFQIYASFKLNYLQFCP